MKKPRRTEQYQGEQAMFRRLIALGLGLGAVITAVPAPAETYSEDCAARAQVVERLMQGYSESLAAGGLQVESAGPTGVIEVYASPATGSFTVLRTDANGQSCILATGTDYFRTTPVLPTASEIGS